MASLKIALRPATLDLNQIDDTISNSMKNSQNVFIKLEGDLLDLLENKLQGRVRDSVSSNYRHENILVSKTEYFSNNINN